MFINKSRHKIRVIDVIRHQNQQVCKRKLRNYGEAIIAGSKIGSSFSMPMLLQRRQRTLIE